MKGDRPEGCFFCLVGHFCLYKILYLLCLLARYFTFKMNSAFEMWLAKGSLWRRRPPELQGLIYAYLVCSHGLVWHCNGVLLIRRLAAGGTVFIFRMILLITSVMASCTASSWSICIKQRRLSKLQSLSYCQCPLLVLVVTADHRWLACGAYVLV